MTLKSVSPESCLYPRWKTQAACWLTHRAVSQFCTAPSYPPPTPRPPLPSLRSGLSPPGGSALAVMTRFPLGLPATPPLILQYGSWVQASRCFLSPALLRTRAQGPASQSSEPVNIFPYTAKGT